MKLLFATSVDPEYFPPPALSDYQIACGPKFPEGPHTLQSPTGDYDIAELVSKLPNAMRPELLVVRVESAKIAIPRNIGALGIPAALIVVDTHHNPQPIQSLLRYALSEPFEWTIFDCCRQHAHFFVEAGVKNVTWFPGLNIVRVPPSPPRPTPDIPVSFAGTIDAQHSHRAVLIDVLRRAGIPLQAGRTSHADTRGFHARSMISLNCSLNGDLNMRTFEILEAGGFLLTDKLGPESGLDLLFDIGRDLVVYEGAEDCLEKIRWFLQNPRDAMAIAKNGKAAYEQKLAPEILRRDFIKLVTFGEHRSEFDIAKDVRAKATNADAVFDRLPIYEALQALQRSQEICDVLITPGVDSAVVSDASDLSRVRLAAQDGSGSYTAVVTTSGDLSSVIRIFDENPDTALIWTESSESPVGFKRLSNLAPIYKRAVSS